MSSVVDERGPEVHGGLLWGTWCCSCQAGGSAWSSAAAEKALQRHLREAHGTPTVPAQREG